MPRTLRIATVQMDAAPASTPDRLARAASLVQQAAVLGAQLIVLPELFNVGYEYHARNYGLAEPLNGQTLAWMKATAAQHGVHLAGSFMLLDGDNVFNSALIVAPDGRTWRYDKIYPYSWERAYFREGRDITIAETDLGRLGMLICWDSAHPDLWRRYAGQVDALVVTSCPPAFQHVDLVLPDGARARASAAGIPIPDDVHFQDHDIQDQAAWMGVPVVASTGAGQFRSHMPMPALSILSLLGAHAELPRFLSSAAAVTLETDYGHYAKIINGDGSIAAQVESEGDGVVVADVSVADRPPQPGGTQPAMRMPAFMRLLVDIVGTTAMIPQYRQELRRQWGAHMAPVDPRTLIWAWAVLGAAVVGYLVGRKPK